MMHDELDRSEGVPWKKNCARELERRRFFSQPARYRAAVGKSQDFWSRFMLILRLLLSMIDRATIPPRCWKIGKMEKAVD